MDPQVTQLDPDAVNLAKAIRQTESGGNFSAKGKSGEYGAYQFTQPTWDTYSKKYGVNVPLTQATPEQQNEVAYKQIKEWKDKGFNVGQIASMWNSGEKNPDAYLDESFKGINKSGAKYDVPAYAKSVAIAYQTLKQGGQVNVDPNNPSSVASTVNQKENPLIGAAKGVGNFLFPIVGDIYHDIKGDQPSKSVAQHLADLGLSALTVIPFLGEESLLARGGLAAAEGATKSGLASTLLKGAGYGAAVGGLGAVSQGGGAAEALKGAGVGAVTGGVLGGLGHALSGFVSQLPERLVGGALKISNEDTARYALNKGLGSPTKMLSESSSSINSLGKQLGSALSDPKYSSIKITANDLLPKLADKFPNAGLTYENVGKKLMQVAPNQKNLITKLVNGEGLSLKELHTLNSEIGSNTYKSVFDTPVMKSGKKIANEFYQTASDLIQKNAPETVPLFDNLTREYALNKALNKAVSSGKKSKLLTLRDIVSMMAGFGAAGPAGAATAYGLEKVASSPTATLKAAGILNKLSNNGLTKKVGQLGGLVAPRIVGQSATKK